jgi:hypothetical protein
MTSRHSFALDARMKAREPDIDAMRKALPDLGESLNTAAHELAHEITIERVDQMRAKIQGADDALLHLRLALAQKVEAHGTG